MVFRAGDVSGAFEQVERRLHRHLVLSAGAFRNFPRRKFYLLKTSRDESVVNVAHKLDSRIRAFDEEVVRIFVGIVEQQDA